LEDTFKTRPAYFLPILGSLLFGTLCAYLVLSSSVDLYSVAPFPEGIGSLGNGIYFVIVAGIGAALLYYLIRNKRRGLISLIIGVSVTLAVLMLSVVYLSAAFSLFAFPSTIALVLTAIFAVCITVLMDIAVFKSRSKVTNFAILFLGGALGAFLGISIPVLSAILILAFLAVYDVFAVYRGPVGKIAQSGLEQLRGMSFGFKNIQIGLGDLTFYSMLTSLVLANAGPVYCAASTAGVLIGAFLAFKMLEKRSMFPGLPFPIALGLLPLIVSFLVESLH
jgi:presenilin-like A22 family membrane protease